MSEPDAERADPSSLQDLAEPDDIGPATAVRRSTNRHDPYVVLRLADVRRFMLGGMAAEIGSQMQGVAVGWELYERTGSKMALGLVGLVQFLPVLLLALPAGHAADRFSRKHQWIVAQALMGVASLGLAALSWSRGPVGLIYACLLMAGTAHALIMPARWALLPELVPTELVTHAVTWNSSSWQIASVAGPALGGLVIARTHGATAAYVLDALFSIIVVVLLLPMRPRSKPRAVEAASLRSLLAGIDFVRRSELILATITLDLFAVLLGGATMLLPVFAKDILRVGPTGLGWLRAAPSIGAFLMALALAHRPPMRHAGRTLLWAVAGFGVATIVFGLSTDARLSFLMLLLTGALDNISVVVRGTLVQVLTPDAMRGRVSAVNAIFIGSSNELGGFESGVTAQLFGPVASVVGGGIGTILVVLSVALMWPQVRRLGSLHDAGRLAAVPSEVPATGR
jgi:MFS family permease